MYLVSYAKLASDIIDDLTNRIKYLKDNLIGELSKGTIGVNNNSLGTNNYQKMVYFIKVLLAGAIVIHGNKQSKHGK